MRGTSAPGVVVIGAGVSGLTTAIGLARRGVPVHVLERDRTPAPHGRRGAGGWYRDSAPQAGQGHVFPPGCYQLLADELPDVLARLLELGARELPVSGGSGGSGGVALAVRRPLFDWMLRRVAEREPGVLVHGGLAATGLRASGGRLSGVQVRDGVVPADLAVDATGAHGPVPGWLDELEHRDAGPRVAEPRRPGDSAPAGDGMRAEASVGAGDGEGAGDGVRSGDIVRAGDGVPAGADHYTRSYVLHWPDAGDPGELNLGGLAAGGDFGGYSCRVVPADNHTFTVTFTVAAGALGSPPTGQTGSAPAGPLEPGLAGLCDPESFQAAALGLSRVGEWVDAAVAEPLTGVTVLSVPAARHGRAKDSARLPGLLAVGDALRTGDPVWCSGLAVALASGLACARAVRAALDVEPTGIRDTGHIAAAIGAAAGRFAEQPVCPVVRLPGPGVAELAGLLARPMPSPVG